MGTVVLAQNLKNQFDNVNIETVLQNDRVLTNYIKCLLDKGACTREGRELKSEYNFRVFFCISNEFFSLFVLVEIQYFTIYFTNESSLG